MMLVLLWTGGITGALCRYYVGRTVKHRMRVFPLSTLIINVTGSFALGLLTRILVQSPDASQEQLRLLFGTGFCGAYTTFSTFALDTVELWQHGRRGQALLNVLLQTVLGGLAAWLGLG